MHGFKANGSRLPPGHTNGSARMHMSLLEHASNVLPTQPSLRRHLSDTQESQFQELIEQFENGAWSRSAMRNWLESLRLFGRCASAELTITDKRHPARNQRISTRSSKSRGLVSALVQKLFTTPEAHALNFNTLRVCTFANQTEHALGFSTLSSLVRVQYLLTEIVDVCTISFVGADASRVVLTLKRRKQFGVFNDEDLRILDRVALKLKQSYNRFLAQTRGFNQRDRLGELVCARSKPSAVVLADGTVESANEAFVRMGRALNLFNIHFETQELQFANDRFTTQFKSEITQFLSANAQPGVTRLYLNTTKLPLIWKIEKFDCPTAKSTAALVTINDPNERPEVTVNEITCMIRATRAEAKLCWSLMQNTSIAVAADFLDISVEQAQIYLSSVLKRNGFKNSGELLIVLNKLAM